ncbi:MAG: ABC transporter substrate-binding protein [Flavobacteriales bacterium]|jgi:peptide/nickel transport system substrate-binding protein|nr:ABC transporter substrate-binding protein [Flavobacteriales bacterium]
MKALFLFIAVSFLWGCQLKDDRRKEQEKTVFRYNESAGISTLDPAYVRRFEDFLAIEQLFNGLVSLDKDLNVEPSIAEAWSISEDGLTYQFNLREDVYFNRSDLFGSKETRRVTASDVVYSFLRIIDPTTASPGKYIFQNLDNSSPDFKAIEAIDENTVVIHLSTPQPSLIYQLSLPYCTIVPYEVVEYFGDDFGLHPIGTGPFYLKKWKKDVKLVMAKNQHYFEADHKGVRLPYLDAVSVYFIQDKHQEFIKFKSGNLEMISGMNEDDKDQLLNGEGELNEELKNSFYLQKIDWLNTDYLGILMDENDHHQNNPLKNKLIRQAIGYAIDRQAMVRYLRNNIGVPATKGFIPQGMPGFEDFSIEGYSYDIEKAMLLIKEAGYESGEAVPVITLSATPEYKTMCEYLQRELSKIGLTIKVDMNSVSSMNQRIAQFEANFYRKSWIADFPDAINYFQLFYSKNFYPEFGSNYTHFKNQEYDVLFELAQVEKDERNRMVLYKKMNQILHDESPAIPLFYAETLRFFNQNVEGIQSNSLNALSLKKVRVLNQNN